ncbi:MAG: hypothetical protein HY606_10720 [Planctomycetes bacterium]|nr:hypothetical protein [Planctomycetota bacterium]
MFYNKNMKEDSFAALPGGELILNGIHDLAKGKETIASLLVSIGEPRLRRLGFTIASPYPDPEISLYLLLARRHDAGAHSKYNSYIRQLVSFERAAECVS